MDTHVISHCKEIQNNAISEEDDDNCLLGSQTCISCEFHLLVTQ